MRYFLCIFILVVILGQCAGLFGKGEKEKQKEKADAEFIEDMHSLGESMKDPAYLKHTMDSLNDPAVRAEVQKMMADPNFRQNIEKLKVHSLNINSLCFALSPSKKL